MRIGMLSTFLHACAVIGILADVSNGSIINILVGICSIEKCAALVIKILFCVMRDAGVDRLFDLDIIVVTNVATGFVTAL